MLPAEGTGTRLGMCAFVVVPASPFPRTHAQSGQVAAAAGSVPYAARYAKNPECRHASCGQYFRRATRGSMVSAQRLHLLVSTCVSKNTLECPSESERVRDVIIRAPMHLSLVAILTHQFPSMG